MPSSPSDWRLSAAYRGEDLIISVMANRHVDWSFGLGRAQFLDGTLSSLDRVSS